jgi:ketosteroid isomerase-like protein
MSQQNVDIIRRSAAVFREGDLDRYVSEFIAPDVEWRTAAEDPDAAIYRSDSEFRGYVDRWMDSFEDLQADLEEWIDVDETRVFTWVRWTGRGRTSGVDADWHLAIVYTLSGGRITRAQEYFDRDEALRSVGLL